MATRSFPEKPRRDASLSRDRIITVAIDILDAGGEAGLTFRVLAERLATGPGAIYWHVASKTDLLTAACDAVIAGTLEGCPDEATPAATISSLAACIFDMFDVHPWIGTALTRAPGDMPGVRILERIGQQVRAMGVPPRTQWVTTCALVSYIAGASQQNAANAHFGQSTGMDRTTMLDDVAATWSALDAAAFPFTRTAAACLRDHDDREDFLAGVDLMLKGIG